MREVTDCGWSERIDVLDLPSRREKHLNKVFFSNVYGK